MKVIIQRVNRARCLVDGKTTGKINFGLMLLVSFTHTDTSENIEKMVNKIKNLRIFEDEFNKMNLSIKEVKGEILSISQFTLYADALKGNRPSFVNCLSREFAEPLYNEFNKQLSLCDIKVETGIFGADMTLDIECCGPVTISLEL